MENEAIGNTSTVVIIPDDISIAKLQEEIFKRIEKASQTTLTCNGNALTITGPPGNVEQTKLMVEVIAHNFNPVVPNRALQFVSTTLAFRVLENPRYQVREW